ncbi:NAD+ synthase [Pseudomonas sp. F1_0610]|uniref:NAD+ synthase n=1 Tax=Pseudomonas sp. F1_0610 TaxID=3114284 RepID=UPI0039C04122
MPSQLHIALAQINLRVGDISGNVQRVLDAAQQAYQQQADLIVFPELTLCGYPAQDLLLRDSMQLRIENALQQLCQELPDIQVILGLPWSQEGMRYNSCAHIHQGKVKHLYFKQFLPNYAVFDEQRYFAAGNTSCIIECKGIKLALSICEDIWHDSPMLQAKKQGAHALISINASPYNYGKQQEREMLVTRQAKQGSMPVIYLNLVGGQDELVFDGNSFACNADGNLAYRAPAFKETIECISLQKTAETLAINKHKIAAPLTKAASVYQALVLAIQDYVQYNGFKGVLLGLSGGIDSALVLALASDALGADKVEAVMMPYHYTAQISQDDAAEQANTLGVKYQVAPIAPMVEAFLQTLTPIFGAQPKGITEENLQARCRGSLLMAMSNKTGALVLTTSNKSETAVGYSTLYGDMAGGFAPLKDVPKTLVFELAKYRNTLGKCIPERVISRPPSAELSPDQKDEDSLPAYPVLDEILRLYVDDDHSANDIIARGFAPEIVMKVLRLVDINEYKRRQAAVGPRITKRSFSLDRRYPITNAWRRGE